MDKFARGIPLFIFLTLLVAGGSLSATTSVAVPDDGKTVRADDRDKKKPEDPGPAKPAAESKKKATGPPECRQMATQKQLNKVAEKLKKLQDKKARQEPQNP